MMIKQKAQKLNNVWTTKDGQKIKVSDMTTQHIKNVLKCIEEERINFGEMVDIGYTADGEGDGRIYEYIADTDKEKYWIDTFNKELKRRENEHLF